MYYEIKRNIFEVFGHKSFIRPKQLLATKGFHSETPFKVPPPNMVDYYHCQENSDIL